MQVAIVIPVLDEAPKPVREPRERSPALEHPAPCASRELPPGPRRVDAERARLNLAQRDLRRSVLRAPFNGSISVRNVEPAMKLASGETAFEMDSGESGLRVEVQVPETVIARVKQGQEVNVRLPSVSADLYPAVVSEVGTRASGGNAFTVKADLIQPVKSARPGMTA